MKTELEAAKRRIEELEQQLGEQRDEPMQDGDAARGVVAAVGVAALFAALRARLNRRHRAELDRIRDASEKDREAHRTELATEREQAARRETEYRQQVEALSLRVERAEQGEREATTSAMQANEIVEELRIHLDEVANKSWQQTFELAKVRAANAQLEGTLTAERQNFSARSKNLWECIDQRDAALNAMEQAHSELERRTEAENQRLTEANQRLQKRLAQREARLERGRAAVADAPKQTPHPGYATLVFYAANEEDSDARASSTGLNAAPQQPDQKRLAPAETGQTECERTAPRKNREQRMIVDEPQARTKSETKKKKRKKKRKKETSGFGESIAAAGRAVVGAVTGLVLGQGMSASSGKRLSAKKESRLLGPASKK